ncbi:MAG TPA: hemerythrin domain-containing protein [Kofleriaceae bacterium]|nr:hemerythrin domain-containing protein [Kofleriaceae bacterium]
MTDPIRNLSHDHADLNQRVVAIASLLRTQAPDPETHDELVLALGHLREDLFLHFAREEEAVFPFIATTVPELAAQIDAMATAHDTICGALARACHLAENDAAVDAIAPVFERFQVVYADHASAESILLRSLDRKLQPAQRDELAALVAGI